MSQACLGRDNEEASPPLEIGQSELCIAHFTACYLCAFSGGFLKFEAAFAYTFTRSSGFRL